ncbi:bifunctional diguanylate cyclase/phosphodiesterase [Metabacillus litoralis]|uniref:bifunctional diguanylate cyclase/phosphodiesterase n=1 Tax=Metabacillus litoralis TaxID=152268 RepID=UPI0013CF3E4A|nr:EAL domain-containing protein [Metabacillus litoralis]
MMRMAEDINFPNEIYYSLFKNNQDACYGMDLMGNFILYNDAFLELSGYKNEDLVGKSFKEFVREPDLATTENHFIAALNGKRTRFETSINHKNGQVVHLQVTNIPIIHDGNVKGLVCSAKDMTDEKRTRKLLDGQNTILEMIAKGHNLNEVLSSLVLLMEDVLDGGLCSILLMDHSLGILRKGTAVNLPSEYNDYINLGVTVGPTSGSCGKAAFTQLPVVVEDIEKDSLWNEHREIALKHNLRACWSYPVLDNQSRTLGTFAVYYPEARKPNQIDMMVIEKATYLTSLALQHYESEKKINFMAYHDELTALPNRRLFDIKASQALGNNKENLAFLFIDLDRFKVINDTLGHNIGDLLLREVAQRITSCIRRNDTAARQGGDEFIILLDNIMKNEVTKISNRILHTLSAPFYIQGKEIFVTPSIGISMYPEDGRNEGELLRKSDVAMYQAKKDGRNTFRFYDLNMDKEQVEQLKIENELRKALYRNELSLSFQPIVDTKSTKVVAVEALLRWQHHLMGNIPPGKFIPIAEENGLIIPIGQWVIENACRHLSVLDLNGYSHISISINLSIRQFYQPNLVAMVASIIKETEVNPARLNFEITESMTADVHLTSTTLNELKALGVSISIDDFGTGYSSLSYLRSFPINTLKIDRSFIKNIPQNKEDQDIATMIIYMAHKLGLKVIGEGVETSEQTEFLLKNGCDMMQGYYFSPPLTEKELFFYLDEN